MIVPKGFVKLTLDNKSHVYLKAEEIVRIDPARKSSYSDVQTWIRLSNSKADIGVTEDLETVLNALDLSARNIGG